MPPTSQEQRCIDLAIQQLTSTVGGEWQVVCYPDDEHPNLATPEVVVSNGQTTAAIEVKRLRDPVFRKYTEAMLANHEYLVPSCGGYYTLAPASGVSVRWDRPLRRHVKRQIERVAPTLVPGTSGVILMPRLGRISLSSTTGGPYIHCLHGGPLHQLLNPLLNRVSGVFMLVDEGPEHSFYTEAGSDAFHDAVVDACKRRLDGDATPFTWSEEWKLTRLADDEDENEDGVYVIAVSEVRDMAESSADIVEAVLANVQRKFSERRWADIHVLVIEGSVGTRPKLVQQVIDELEPDDLKGIDQILLVDHAASRVCLLL